MKKINLLKGFTLIEILVGILIFSLVIIGGFQALSSVTVGKIKLIEETNIEKEAFYFSEKLFEEIKKGGLIDYEEYFNRRIVNIGKSSLYSSGHYLHNTGFGNFGGTGLPGSTNYGNKFYYCLSPNGGNMGNDGCFSLNNDLDGISTTPDSVDYSGKPQRYGQYSFQFIDYNSNGDDDKGDEDGNGKIIGDYDDDYLGLGPNVFISGTDVKELYLVSGSKNKRVFFRWKVSYDKNHPTYNSSTNTNSACDFSNPDAPIGNGCIGTIEFLKMDGVDWGMDHNNGIIDTDGTQYDGVIDTWLIDKDFTSGASVVAGSNFNSYWVPLFPETISVSSFSMFVYPNKDLKNAWKDNSTETNIAPYVRVNFTLIPSVRNRKGIKGTIPEINISTTISLTDVFSK